MMQTGAGRVNGLVGTVWWAGGLSLAERLAAPRPPRFGDPCDNAAERRLDAWRADFGAPANGRFAARLGDAGLDEDALRALLTEPPAALAARAGRPAWAALAAEALDTAPATGADPGPAPSWADGFAAVLAPFTAVAVRRLEAAPSWAAARDTVDTAALRRDFTEQLAAQLTRIARRTLVLELNVLRVAGQLAGATPQARFADFVRQLSGRERLSALLAEYPVLARLLAQAAGHAVDAWAELLERFAADRPAVVATLLAGRDPGPLATVRIGAGDRHDRGRAVALLGFADGSRAVYKPRPVAVHRRFNELLAWLGERMPGPGQRCPAVLDRPGYGWVEFAAPAPCGDLADVARFYRRLGVLLAVLHLTGGTDIHYENLIACGDQPVLVDLETLFHPDLGRPGPPGGDPAAAALERSVRRIALLPFPLVGPHGVLDPSGLGGDRGGLLPTDVVDWAAPGTDQMRLVRGRAAFPGGANRPRLDGVDADVRDHTDDLLAGFRAGYRALHDGAAELGGPTGLLAAFAEDAVRVLVRPTRRYAALLDESTHPDVLRDALDRDRVLDVLWRESAADPMRRPLVAAETAQLWAGDVPLLTARPAARRPSADGRPVGPGWSAGGLHHAQRRLAGLGGTDLHDQEWIIRAALATRAGRTAPGGHPGAGGGPPPPP
ncbi:type 2 lanthipeptide synthetase LanM family protein, partial [Kitasatospora sp. NPDC059571]|uniref:type 2 lanthipeptide synthetase LanM family protein n=1 Tax=Kitasatospora sp. NPDC059571 TaxID=3346871 RepID=UPI0036B8A390